MAKNIEIKARAFDFEKQQNAAKSLSDSSAETLLQTDTFFRVESGRLKLREFPDAPAQLIYYQRDDSCGPTLSDYHITESEDGSGLKSLLEKAYGVRQVVKKKRLLYRAGRTRLHFDTVEKLGQFIELEVVLNQQDTLESGQREAQALMKQLSIEPKHLVAAAYVDLLENVA